MTSQVLSIGGKIDGSHLLKGAISALEIYVGDKKMHENGVPDALKHLIIKSQLIETQPEKNEEPPAKKKKRKLQPISE